MYYIGIDPGKSAGGLIIFDENNDIIFSHSFDKQIYIDTFKQYKDNAQFAIEHVHSIYGDGGTQAFNFGENFGWTKGVLDTYGIQYNEIEPSTWKKYFGLKRLKKEKIDSFKRRSCELALQLCPSISNHIILGQFSRGPRKGMDKFHDGIAEAYLIARFNKEKLKERKD